MITFIIIHYWIGKRREVGRHLSRSAVFVEVPSASEIRKTLTTTRYLCRPALRKHLSEPTIGTSPTQISVTFETSRSISVDNGCITAGMSRGAPSAPSLHARACYLAL